MWFHHNNLVSFKVTLNALLIAKVFIMSIFVLTLKGITTLMESRFWKTQAPPPKQSKFPAKPSCETKIGECTWNAFVHKSLYLFSRWHLSTAFIFALLSSPWLDRHTVVTFGGKPAWEVSAFCSSPHLCVQDLRHSYSFLKAPADPSIHPPKLSRILCAAPLLIPHPRGANPSSSPCWLCAHMDPWWPSTAKIWIRTAWGMSSLRKSSSLIGSDLLQPLLPCPSRQKLRSCLSGRRIIAGLWLCSSLKWS